MSVIQMPAIADELDTSGLACPLPILKTRKAMGALGTGEVLRIVATDPGSLADMASFCKQTGHQLLASDERDGRFEFLIHKH